MNPREYEYYTGEYFKKKGYKVELTPETNDYGVDLFIYKNSKKIAIQVKMYGQGTRPINRQMIMELCGAMNYFDCNQAKFVTDGRVLNDALEVAEKLNIEIINLSPDDSFKINVKDTFSDIWTKYIIPLKGKTLIRSNGKENKIVLVDWSGIKRITSNGNTATIKIEIFKQVINYLEKNKEITRKAINDDYLGRASSGICLILSQVPFIDYLKNPARLVWKK